MRIRQIVGAVFAKAGRFSHGGRDMLALGTGTSPAATGAGGLTKPCRHRATFAIAYVAFGRDHIRQAVLSAVSARRHMPHAEIVVVADEPFRSPAVDRVILHPGSPPGHRLEKAAKIAKARAILAAHTACVLYVDTDTHFAADVSDVFEDPGFDVAACLDTWQDPEIYRRHNAGLPGSDPPGHQPFLNTGVLFVRRGPRTRRLLDGWLGPFAADPRIRLEQLTFREAIYRADLRLRILPGTYNARLGEPIHLSGPVRIAHRADPCALSEVWQDSLPSVTDFVNATTTNRVFVPAERCLFVMGMDGSAGVLRMRQPDPPGTVPLDLTFGVTSAVPA